MKIMSDDKQNPQTRFAWIGPQHDQTVPSIMDNADQFYWRGNTQPNARETLDDALDDAGVKAGESYYLLKKGRAYTCLRGEET